MTENIEFTDEERQLMEELGLGGGYPKPEEKASTFAFFKKILFLKDSLKVSNLSDQELGLAEFPVRTTRGLSLFCDKMGSKFFSNIFKDEGEIVLASSLSRKGFLDKLAVTTKKESRVGGFDEATRTKRGLFSKKQEEVTET